MRTRLLAAIRDNAVAAWDWLWLRISPIGLAFVILLLMGIGVLIHMQWPHRARGAVRATQAERAGAARVTPASLAEAVKREPRPSPSLGQPKDSGAPAPLVSHVAPSDAKPKPRSQSEQAPRAEASVLKSLSCKWPPPVAPPIAQDAGPPQSPSSSVGPSAATARSERKAGPSQETRSRTAASPKARPVQPTPAPAPYRPSAAPRLTQAHSTRTTAPRVTTPNVPATGSVRVGHSMFGMVVDDTTLAYAARFHQPYMLGAVVLAAEQDGPGARAGLRVGDLIVSAHGSSVQSAVGLWYAVAQGGLRTPAPVRFLRQGALSQCVLRLPSLCYARRGPR